jgi:hypothetical protein
MDIALSPTLKAAIAEDAAIIRVIAEGCESLPYTSYRNASERAAFVGLLKHAKNAAIALDALSRFRGDVSFLLPTVKVELRRALVRGEYLPNGGLANALRSRLLCAQERLAAIDEGER